MSRTRWSYRGNVNIYLEGAEALEVSEPPSTKKMAYFIGAPESMIKVIDFRHSSTEAALKALEGNNELCFADVFNEPAWIEINDMIEEIKIEMHETNKDGDYPTLWLGVLIENTMPIHPVTWEILKPLSDSRTAFAALVPQTIY